MCACVFVCEYDMRSVRMYARMHVLCEGVLFLCVLCKYILCMFGAAQQCVHMHVCVIDVSVHVRVFTCRVHVH